MEIAPRITVDEKVRFGKPVVKGKGFEVYDIRDHGLRGQADETILSSATQKKAILITGDLGFGNRLRYPVGSHGGIVVAHFPNEPSTSELNAQILGSLSVLSEDDLRMSLTILEPGKIRSRKN